MMSLSVNDRECLGYPAVSRAREVGVISVFSLVGHRSVALDFAWEKLIEIKRASVRRDFGLVMGGVLEEPGQQWRCTVDPAGV
jgi:hypothetical protein